MEFALLAPFVMIMLLIVLDLAIVVDQREVLDHSIREGARAAALGDSTTAVAARTAANSDGVIDPGDVSVCYYDVDGNGEAGDFGDGVQVSISHAYTFALGGELAEALGLGTPSIDLSPRAEVRLEQEVMTAPEC